MDKSEEDKKLQEYIKELVIARINALSKDLEISIGGENITREQIVEVIDEAKSKGITVLDLEGKKAS